MLVMRDIVAGRVRLLARHLTAMIHSRSQMFESDQPTTLMSEFLHQEQIRRRMGR
jgi:hypothetical protein